MRAPSTHLLHLERMLMGARAGARTPVRVLTCLRSFGRELWYNVGYRLEGDICFSDADSATVKFT